MARRGRAVAASAAAVLCLGGAGCGGAKGTAARGLGWDKQPIVLAPRDLPLDRIAVGRVRNFSSHALHLTAARISVRDAAGHALNSSGAYTASFAHGLYGAFQQPSALPIAEQVRLGRLLDLAPGATAPFFAAWRLARGSRQPVRIEYGSGSLPVSARPQPTPR